MFSKLENCHCLYAICGCHTNELAVVNMLMSNSRFFLNK
jgi:hypothetical protein